MTHGLVIFAKNVERVSAFYQRALNLEVKEKQKSHTVLISNEIEIVIHAMPAKVAAGITITEPPALRGTSAIKPAFVVDDLEAVRVLAKETGGTLKPLKGAWDIRGAKVLDGCDPEGNVVQFKQQLN